MGTRAAFFVGNPQDTETRKWLGCIAYDGYPDQGIGETFSKVADETGFVAAVEKLKDRDDFCDPKKHGWPFPWADDLFLTDYVYAWFDGRVMLTSFYCGWISLADYMDPAKEDAYHLQAESLPHDTPAPTAWDRSGPDSIMILRA